MNVNTSLGEAVMRNEEVMRGVMFITQRSIDQDILGLEQAENYGRNVCEAIHFKTMNHEERKCRD